MDFAQFLTIIRRATPMLALAVSVSTFLVMRLLLNLDDLEVLDCDDALDYRWRLYWGLSVVALMMALAWSYSTSIRITIERLSKSGRFIYLAGNVALAAIIATVAHFYEVGGRNAAVQLQALAESTSIDIPGIIWFLNFLAILTIAAIVITATILILEAGETEPAIRRKTTDLHRSLYSSSALLGAGIVEVFCLYGWAASQSADLHAKSANTSLTIAAGILFSLILLAIYVPLFMKRNELLKNFVVAKEFNSKGELDDWYAINHLEKVSGSGPYDVIAFALPIISGVAVNVLSRFISG